VQVPDRIQANKLAKSNLNAFLAEKYSCLFYVHFLRVTALNKIESVRKTNICINNKRLERVALAVFCFVLNS
jgi:hypothetical protein